MVLSDVAIASMGITRARRHVPGFDGSGALLAVAEWAKVEPLLPRGRRGAHRLDLVAQFEFGP
jgi:hypothetical protein